MARGFLLIFRSKGNIKCFESKLLSFTLCLFKDNACVSHFFQWIIAKSICSAQPGRPVSLANTQIPQSTPPSTTCHDIITSCASQPLGTQLVPSTEHQQTDIWSSLSLCDIFIQEFLCRPWVLAATFLHLPCEASLPIVTHRN